MHSAEGFTHDNWWQANSIAGLMKVLEAFHKGGGSSSPLLVSSTKHWDQIYISRFYNWKAGSWKGAYGYAGTYKLKPDAPDADDAVRTLSSFYVPVFEKMLADGTIVEYEIDREMIHTTDSRAQLHFSFVMPSAAGLDKFRAALGAALDENSLIGPAFGSMMVNFRRRRADICTGQRNLQVVRAASGRVAGIARYSRGRKNAADTIFSDDSGRRARRKCDGAGAGCRLCVAFGTQGHSRRDRCGNHRARGQGSSLHEGPVNTRSAHDVRFTRRGRSANLYASRP